MNTRLKLSRSALRKQAGFTLIELGVVAVILVVLVALATPAIREYIISGRVPSSGQDLSKAIVTLKQSSALSNSATPYSSVGTVDKYFTNSNFKVSGTTVTHDLGFNGGAIVLDSLSSGAAVSLTLWGISPSACPGLANAISKSADAIEVGQGGTVATPTAPTAATAIPTATTTNVVKIPGGTYNASAAAAACNTAGQNNYMRFYIGV
jgi:prepilin-type N-terminal cleavage/methylation domain-containing protein